jgi:hypothetical protein
VNLTHRSRRRLAVALGAAGLAAATAVAATAGGSWSLFSATASPPTPQNFQAGTVVLDLGSAGSSTGDALTIGVGNMAPGNTVARAVTLTNAGTLPLASIAFAVSSPTTPSSTCTTTACPLAFGGVLVAGGTSGGASTNPLLGTSTSASLQIEVQSCPTSWSATALSDGGYSYTCSGTTTTLVPQEPVGDALSAPVTWTSGLNALNPGGVDYLLVTVSLPTSAPNSDQGLSATLTYAFEGTQAAVGAA